MDDFRSLEIRTSETSIFAETAGSGPPVLLLHGFPETHLMWRHVAPVLAKNFCVVCADLRGYGLSGCPASTDDHFPYSKRALAQDMIELMGQLGFESFSVVGHDRGGRVAYRMALDHPDRIARLGVLDIVPTETAWSHADSRLALSFWPWSVLAQPASLPERILLAVPEAVIDDAFSQWGSKSDVFTADVRDAYVDALRDPQHAHAICEEYRAAAMIDREHDREDVSTGRRIKCPVLVLWGANGALDTWYVDEGGPLELWRQWANNVGGFAIKGGHFFPEEAPDETARALTAFLSDG